MSWLPSSSEQTSYQYSNHNSANHMRGGMCRHVLLGFFKELGDALTCGIGCSRCEAETSWCRDSNSRDMTASAAMTFSIQVRSFLGLLNTAARVGPIVARA